MKGKLIVIEGTDCSGKQTQTELLEKRLKEKNYPCIRIDFPRYDTPTGKIVGGCYLGKPEIGPSFFPEGAICVDPHIASLYFAADRKYNIKLVNQYLEQGYYVILDRYTTSNLAHQGSKILDREERFHMYQWIDKLEYWLLELPKPDITIFLHMPYLYSKELKKNRTQLDEHEKSEDHLRHAEACYLELRELYNWSYVNCILNDQIRSVEDINQEILNKVLDSDAEEI